MASVKAQVAHVWRRLGFGARPADLARGVRIGPQALIDDLVARPATTPSAWAFPAEQGWEADQVFVDRMFHLMAYGANPVEERIAWILLGLVVCAMTELVQAPDMRDHVRLLRGQALGSYRRLLRKVTTSAPMLSYLSGRFSTRDRPNQNYARELMELFALGITHPITKERNYTEADIAEMARALTGWEVSWDDGSVHFVAEEWDPGDKRFLGRLRPHSGVGEVLAAVNAHPAWPYFVPARFYREIVGLEPDAAVLESLAEAYGPSGDLRALVAAIARRPELLSDAAIHSRVKCPVELIVSAARAIGFMRFDQLYLSNWTLERGFGQHPWWAPNVSGWPSGPAWLQTQVYASWTTMASEMVWRDDGQTSDPERINPVLRRLFETSTQKTIVSRALRAAGIVGASRQTRRALHAYATAGGWSYERSTGVMNLALLAPEFFVS